MTGSKIRPAVLALSLSLLYAAPAFAEDPPVVAQPGASTPPSPANPIGAPAESTPAAPAAGAPVPPPAPLPELSLNYDKISGSMENALLMGAVRLNYGGELFVEADRVEGDLIRQRYIATGGIKAYDKLIVISAQKLDFNGSEHIGFTEDALLYQRPYRIQAGSIQATPVEIVAEHARLATVPPGVSPDFEIRASKITLFQDPRLPAILRVRADDASFYLFHNHFLTLRRVKFRSGGTSGGGGDEATLIPSFGESGRYGAFAQVQYRAVGRVPFESFLLVPTKGTPQERITAHQTLISGHVQSSPPPPPARQDPLTELHRFEQAASPPLPYGDPMLFHDFLPETATIRPFESPWGGGLFTSEEASGHISASGRRRDDLYVSRLPELRLDGSLPLMRVHAAPPPGDPVTFRDFLRRPVIYANAGLSAGEYYEEPTSIRGSRDRVQVGLSTRPWLVAKNTLILPTIQNTYNHYDASRSMYQYTQTSLAIQHYFTDRSALGMTYLTSKVSGDSPFNFDVLDTSRELDTRAQIGNHNFALSGLVRYDLERQDVLDYKITLAPTLHGFIPTFTYNFQNRSLNVNFEVEGLSF